MTRPNAELAYRVLDHIDAHPEQWDQGTYIAKAECGTVACFAGWTVLLSGEQPYFGRDDEWAETSYVSAGATVYVSELAEELLGVSRFVPDDVEDIDEDSCFESPCSGCTHCGLDLFAGGNTRDELGRLVEVIFGPRPDVPAVTS